MAGPLLKRRFTVEEYRKMGLAGVLKEDDRVELIEGEVVQMSPIGKRHAATVKRLNRLLGQSLGDRAVVSIQDPISLGEHSEPQPDVALLKPRKDFYASGHPRPTDVLLVIEVMESPKDYDRDVKLRLCARHAIPETWLVDLEKNGIDVFRRPAEERYGEKQEFGAGTSITPQAFPDLKFPVDSILA